MISNVGHLYVFFGKVFKTCANFFLMDFFLLLSYMISLYILLIDPLTDT